MRIRSLTGSKSRISVLDKERERLKKKKEVPAFLHFIREGKLSLHSSIERERESWSVHDRRADNRSFKMRIGEN